MAFQDVWKPRLGLDLQGGTSVTLKPKPAPGEAPGTITDDAINQAVDIIAARVNGFGVAEAEVTSQGSGADSVIVVSVPGVTEGDLVNQIGKTARLGFRPVLAVQAGTPTPTPPSTPNGTGGNGTGGNGTGGGGTGGNGTGGGNGSGGNQSGGSNGALLPDLNARAAHLAVERSADNNNGGGGNGNNNSANNGGGQPSPSASASPSPSSTAPGSTGQPSAELQKQFTQLDCSDQNQKDVGAKYGDDEYAIACNQDGQTKYLLGPVAIPGSDVDTASANLSQNSAGWEVSLDFNGAGTKTFGAITAQMAQAQHGTPANQFAIVLDGLVVSAPGVDEAIPGGQAQITGQFTQQQAKDLANVLKYGALPLTFEMQERSTVSPTLGADQLHAGLVAGGLGLALVVIYLLLYYRALAFVAVASLGVATYLNYAAVVLLGESIGFTLTLAGVAGLIVAIGITADSFIVYFERIRDEVREGRSLRTALETGWVRARRTVVAADSISLIAAVVLYVLSVGSVRGFAFTLGLTTVIDLVVVFMFTKPVVTLLARTKFFSSGSRWSGLSPERLGARARPAPAQRRQPKVAGAEEGGVA